MNHLLPRRLLLPFLALFSYLVFCAGLLSGNEGKIRIMATVLPLAEFAGSIAGEFAEVDLLLPPGADVHTWQPRISDIRRLERADLIVSIGRGLEPWLNDLLKGISSGRSTKLEAANGLNILLVEDGNQEEGKVEAHSHGLVDPHIWLDFSQDELIVDAMAAALSRLDPERTASFAQKAEALKERLRALDKRYRGELEAFKGRKFLIAGHAAFAYLARRYDLRQVAVYGMSPDAAPTTRETAGVIARAEAERTTTVYFEPSTGDKMARLIADEIGADVRVLYPGHNLTPEQNTRGTDFFQLMEENLENLIHGFTGRR